MALKISYVDLKTGGEPTTHIGTEDPGSYMYWEGPGSPSYKQWGSFKKNAGPLLRTGMFFFRFHDMARTSLLRLFESSNEMGHYLVYLRRLDFGLDAGVLWSAPPLLFDGPGTCPDWFKAPVPPQTSWEVIGDFLD